MVTFFGYRDTQYFANTAIFDIDAINRVNKPATFLCLHDSALKQWRPRRNISEDRKTDGSNFGTHAHRMFDAHNV